MTFLYQSDSTLAFSEEFLLEGVWIHDPDSAQDTVKNYRFGKDAKNSSIDIIGAKHVFAGRRFPVFEYGEHQEDKVSVSIIVDHGPDYMQQLQELRDFAELKKTIVYRDNRGRMFYGAISGFSDSDKSYGSDVSFEVQRVDREEVTP